MPFLAALLLAMRLDCGPNRAAADAAEMLDRSRRTNGGAFDVALVYIGLGDNNQAFTWLDKAVDDRSLGFEWMHATVNSLRSDPRFEKIGRRVGLQTR